MDNLSSKVYMIREAAARFYAVDLHLHSPYSYDWNNSGTDDTPRNPNLDRIPVGNSIPEIAVATYRESLESSSRNLVAVTDHNVSSFGEAAASKNDSSGPTVLPGVELCVAFSDAPLIRDLRIHVLAIFPEDAHHEAIARILPAGTPAEADRDPSSMLTYPSADELIHCIHREGGLAIAAHIESANGIRGVYKNTAELLLETVGGTPEAQEILRRLGDQVKDELVKFDAIQVKPTTDVIHYAGPSGELRVPLIVASDTHKGPKLPLEQSAKYSYIKMARPSFASLCDAFKFPDLRIRLESSLPESKPPKLLGLRLVGHKTTDNTFFDDTILGFSDNLTCIIGPRGSGKSAAIDALRYLMGYNRTLDQIGKVSEQVTDRQKHTLEKTRIEAVYQAADKNVYKIVATYDAHEEYVTEVYNLDGDKLNIEDVEACGEFPLNLFGWGELELLAEKPETQRELLDHFIPDVFELKASKGKCYLRLIDNRSECVKKARALDEYFNDTELEFRRLNEFKQQFEELNTEEIEALFGQLDTIKAKRKILINITRELQARLDDGDIAPVLEIGKLLEDEAVQEWAESLTARLKPAELDDWMRATSQEHQAKIETALALVKAEDENLERQEKKAEKEIQTVIGEDQAITGDLRNGAKTRYDKSAANYEKYKKLYGEFEELFTKRNAILDEIKDYENRIFATRNQETSRIGNEVSLVEDENFQIDLVLEQRADRTEFLAALYQGLLKFAGNWKAGKRPEIISAKMTPRLFVEALIKGDSEALNGLSVQIDSREYSLKTKDAEQLVLDNATYTDVDGIDAIQVDPDKLDALLRIQEVPIDDAFFITLGGKPIQYCSPGQRCSAMLPVVTLTSQAPLVIDQPEDNLDNRLVSRALFKILARLKETRQIILATHNPNILVSGDAEQVLLLNPIGELEQYGCIDDPAIIDSVLSLMEGGTEAFERRHIKYKPYL